jgi:membrane protein DedA with SNARE-associated domain
LAEILELLEQWIEGVIRLIGYPGISFLMVVENLLPPIPSEWVMTFAGFQAAEGQLNVWIALLAGTLGSTLGALCVYALGHKIERRRLNAWIRKYGKFILLSEEDLNQVLDTFDRHGKMAVFFGRLIPGVRSLISLPAGIDHMPLPGFLALTFLGSGIWNAILLYAGMVLHDNWRDFLNIIRTYENVLWILTGAAALFFVAHRLRRRWAAQAGD